MVLAPCFSVLLKPSLFLSARALASLNLRPPSRGGQPRNNGLWLLHQVRSLLFTPPASGFVLAQPPSVNQHIVCAPIVMLMSARGASRGITSVWII